MRIAIASYQGYDGAGVLHAHEFANCLVDRGHQVLFLLNGDKETAKLVAEPPRYRLLEVTFEPASGLMDAEVRRAVERFSPEILHLWTPRHLPARVALEVWDASDARLLIHYEDDEEYILAEVGSNDRFGPDDRGLYRFFLEPTCEGDELRRWVEGVDRHFLRLTLFDPICWRWVHPMISPVAEKLADAYTSISPSYRRYLRRRSGKEVWTLYPGVDHQRFSPRSKPPELVARFGLEGRTVLLYSGSIAPFHDFVSVLEALPRVVLEHPDVVVVQVGHNYMREVTDELIPKLGLENHVVFAGPATHAEMPDRLALADVFIGSVRIDEFNGHRLPSKVPEYLAMGRPLLIMDHGIGHELESGTEAEKVTNDSPEEIAGALKRLLARREEWGEMGRRLRRKAKKLFDWQRSTDHLVTLYEEVLETPRRSELEGLDSEAPIPAFGELGFTRPAPQPEPGRRGDRRRVVIYTEGLVGEKMSGTGIRYLEMAQALARRFDVALGHCFPVEREFDTFEFFEWSSDRHDEALAWSEGADVVLTHGWVLEKLPGLARVDARLVIDLYCPFVFENLEIHRDRGVELEEREGIHDNDLRVLMDQLRAGDYFIGCTALQRDWILGMLTALGRLRPKSCGLGAGPEDFVATVPFGLPEEPPKPSDKRVLKGVWPGVGKDDFVLLWGGGLWSWLDPRTIIEAMAEVRKKRSDVKLVFLSTRTAQKVINMPELGAALELAERLGLDGETVIFNRDTYIDYESRGDYFLEADLGVCAHDQTLETHFAFRTRVLDYLNAGLPILTSRGDFFADYVEDNGLGRAVEIHDGEAWATAILEFAENEELCRTCREDVLGKRGDFTWPKVVAPVVDYCSGDWEKRPGLAPEMRLLEAPEPELVTATPVDTALEARDLDALSARLRSQLEAQNLERHEILVEYNKMGARLHELEQQHGWMVGHVERLEAKVNLIRRLPFVEPLWRWFSRS